MKWVAHDKGNVHVGREVWANGEEIPFDHYYMPKMIKEGWAVPADAEAQAYLESGDYVPADHPLKAWFNSDGKALPTSEEGLAMLDALTGRLPADDHDPNCPYKCHAWRAALLAHVGHGHRAKDLRTEQAADGTITHKLEMPQFGKVEADGPQVITMPDGSVVHTLRPADTLNGASVGSGVATPA